MNTATATANKFDKCKKAMQQLKDIKNGFTTSIYNLSLHNYNLLDSGVIKNINIDNNTVLQIKLQIEKCIINYYGDTKNYISIDATEYNTTQDDIFMISNSEKNYCKSMKILEVKKRSIKLLKILSSFIDDTAQQIIINDYNNSKKHKTTYNNYIYANHEETEQEKIFIKNIREKCLNNNDIIKCL